MRLALAALLFSLQPACAGSGYFNTGNALNSFCQSDRVYVSTYMVGVADAFSLNFSGQKNYICLPPTATSTQLADMACKFIKENPEERHLPASGIAYQVLIKNFRCPD